jgi:hypothetical protein
MIFKYICDVCNSRIQVAQDYHSHRVPCQCGNDAIYQKDEKKSSNFIQKDDSRGR